MRGIATGTSFRRLVARTLARQFTEVKAASPFQVALSTRAGVDCVGHAVRAATDANPMTTVLSVDGIGAYDHVYRASMMSKAVGSPQFAPSLAIRATSVRFRHRGKMQTGNALAEVKLHLLEGECLFAFLDDLCPLQPRTHHHHLQHVGQPIGGHCRHSVARG